jgi:hypothetical protein
MNPIELTCPKEPEEPDPTGIEFNVKVAFDAKFIESRTCIGV